MGRLKPRRTIPGQLLNPLFLRRLVAPERAEAEAFAKAEDKIKVTAKGDELFF